jgi:hypothetical protein
MNLNEEHKRIPNICRVLGLARRPVSKIRDKGKGNAIPWQAYYRPWGVPGGRGSQISRQSSHEGGKVVSPTHQSQLPPPENIPDTHFC